MGRLEQVSEASITVILTTTDTFSQNISSSTRQFVAMQIHLFFFLIQALTQKYQTGTLIKFFSILLDTHYPLDHKSVFV